MAISERLIGLLEQHPSYDLGDAWSVSKRDNRWHIYFRGKHIDCWNAEYRNKEPTTLNSYDSVVDATLAAEQFKESEPWYRNIVEGDRCAT